MATFKKTRVTNLYRNEDSGIYYMIAKIEGKKVRRSLKTDKFPVAKTKLPRELDRARTRMRSIAEVSSLDSRRSDLEVFSVGVEEWLERKGEAGLKGSSMEYYDKISKVLLDTVGSERAAKQIDLGFVKDWWGKISDRYSPQRANNTLSALSDVLDIQKSHGVRDDNPASVLKRVPIPRKEMNMVSRSDFKELVLSVRSQNRRSSEEAADMIEWMAYTGMRIGEVQVLTWEDVGEEFITVRGVKGRGVGVVKMRRVPIFEKIRSIIDRRRDDDSSGNVFSMKSPVRALTNVCQRLELPHLRVHDLRHLFATVCIESGVDIPTVSKWLGHSDGGVLAMKVYGHLRDDHSLKAAKKVKF